jgi:ferredoxin
MDDAPTGTPTGGPSALVDRDSCVSSARCITAAPELFGYDDEGIAMSLHAPTDLERLIEVARLCPASAITVVDTRGQHVELYEPET